MKKVILTFIFLIGYITVQNAQTNCQVIITYTPTSCSSCADGSAAVQCIGCCSPSYTWIPTGANTSSIHNIPAGTYIVTIQDIAGPGCCNGTVDTVTVTSTSEISK